MQLWRSRGGDTRAGLATKDCFSLFDRADSCGASRSLNEAAGRFDFRPH